MPLRGEYLGMPIAIGDLDAQNQAFYRYCGAHDLHLQRCGRCDLLRYPPTTACPFCSSPEAVWMPVEGRGTVYSYGEVHHAIQPAFRAFAPYLLLLVELDIQRGVPGEFDGLRMTANLATPEGELAPPELVRQVGIGTRVRIVYRDVGEGLAVPLFAIDETVEQPAPWRYPLE